MKILEYEGNPYRRHNTQVIWNETLGSIPYSVSCTKLAFKRKMATRWIKPTNAFSKQHRMENLHIFWFQPGGQDFVPSILHTGLKLHRTRCCNVWTWRQCIETHYCIKATPVRSRIFFMRRGATRFKVLQVLLQSLFVQRGLFLVPSGLNF